MKPTKTIKLLAAWLLCNGHENIRIEEEKVSSTFSNQTWEFSAVRDGTGVFVEYRLDTFYFYRDGKLIKKTEFKDE